MNPRILLTTIGATALAFAVAIVGAAGSLSGAATPRSAVVALAAPAAPAPTARQVETGLGDSARLASWLEPCLLAL
jgi:hypothetical protein